MCGIFGYVGKEITLEALLDGLFRLEYRGYDSCGLAGIKEKSFFVKKTAGKIFNLKDKIKIKLKEKFTNAILHTRWATHGTPTNLNAHPHLDCKNKFALVHNGIIENYYFLKKNLIEEGHKFISETDTEVIVHLVEKFFENSFCLEDAVIKTVNLLEGSFALGIISLYRPDLLIAVKKNSPLIIGIDKEAKFIASDIPALLPFTKEIIYLKDNSLAILSKNNVKIFDFIKKKEIFIKKEKINLNEESTQKNDYPHYMLKEIFEQPKILRNIFSYYLKRDKIIFNEINLSEKLLKKIEKIYLTGCGTAYHAGLVGKYFLEKYVGLDMEVDTASEFRYRNLNFRKNSLLIAISQSGETADTLAVVRRFEEENIPILSICNVLGSSLVKESTGFISTLAGPEIGVASTKAYTAQIVVFFLFSLYLALLKNKINKKNFLNLIEELKIIPKYQEEILNKKCIVEKISQRFSKFGSFLFLGRGINYPSALEGALKLKEISYIPAEGYPAGEMKHGPIALIDEYRAVVCIVLQDNLYKKMFSNLQEIKARRGKILGILNINDNQAKMLCEEKIFIPLLKNQDLSPLLVALPLQLFAYFVAKNLGYEIDQPRNLAKSVTVE